jgi:hypothetical protein
VVAPRALLAGKCVAGATLGRGPAACMPPVVTSFAVSRRGSEIAYSKQ